MKQQYKLKGERNVSARKPLVYNNHVYVVFIYDKGSFIQSRLQCLSLTDFGLKWEYVHDHVLNNIVISANGKLFCSCMDRQVKCFDPDNGEMIWEFVADSKSNIGRISNVEDDRLLVCGVNAGADSTWCIDTNTGKPLWKIANNGHAYTPLIADNCGYFCCENSIYAVSMENGVVNWKQSDPDTYLFNPKCYDDHAFVGGHGKVNVYDVHSGKLNLTIETGKTGLPGAVRQLCFDEEKKLYFGDGYEKEGSFYCYQLKETGGFFTKKKIAAGRSWVYEARGAIQGVAAIQDDVVYFLSDSAELIALNRFDGSLKQVFNIKGEAGNSEVTIHNDELFVACGKGYLYRIEI